MNMHLTEEQLHDRLLGVADAAAAGHLEQCGRCRAEVERVGAALGEFRRAAVAWSERAPAGAARPGPRAVGMPTWMRWAVAAAVVAAVGLPVLRREAAHPAAAKVAAAVSGDSAEQIARDNRLLATINSEVSEAVPAPMEPLSPESEAQPQENFR